MTRDHKLALIIGFSLVLVVGVLISDHFSKARSAQVATEITPGSAASFGNGSQGLRVVSAADPTPSHGPTIITPPGYSAPAAVLPPTAEPTPAAPAGTIVMGVTEPRASTLLERGVDALGAQSALVRDAQVRDAGGVRPIDPATGTLAANPSPLPAAGPMAGPAAMPQSGSPTPAPRTLAAKDDLVNGVPRSMMKRYDVREGESLYRIAQETYGDGSLWSKLVDYNKGKIAANGSMREGVTLLLPPKEALLGKPLPSPTLSEAASKPGSVSPSPDMADPKRTSPPARTPAKPDPKAERAVAAAKTYTVQKGDSLSDIAKKTLGSSRRWSEIVDMNKDVLDDENALVVGVTLKLPSR